MKQLGTRRELAGSGLSGVAARSLWSRVVECHMALALAATASTALEAESPHCKRVRALADSRAALLHAPSIEVEGGKFPDSAAIARSARANDEYQVRVALSLSLLDVYKARHVVRAGESECAHYEAGRVLEDVVFQAADYGRLPALRRTAGYLDTRRGSWREIEQWVQAALAARVVSLLEAHELRDRCAELERHRAAVDGELARLEAVEAAAPAEMDLTSLIHVADGAAMQYERETSHLRSLEAWEFRVTGGAVPDDSSTALFGLAELSFNFGAFAQRAAEHRVLEAREEELHRSRSELREKLRMFRALAAARATPPAGLASSESGSRRSVPYDRRSRARKP